MTASVFAQQQAGWMSPSNEEVAAAWGWAANDEGKMAWSKEKTPHPAGTLIAETESVVLRTAFADDCSGASINKLKLTYYSVNGIDYKTEGDNNVWQGAVGNTNPKALNLEDIQITTGWVLDYEVKADGYLTVLSQASLNKNLYVIEGAMSDEGVVANGAVAYDFFVVCDNQPEGLEGIQFSYKLPADEEGYLDMDAAAGKFVDGGTIMWPYRIFMGDAAIETSDKKYPNTNAATVFPVYEGCHYYYFCTGSKVTAGPYIFTKEYPTSLSFTKEIKDGDEVTSTEVYNLIGEGSAVKAVEAVLDVNAPIYNAQGVRVNADAKGILIQNGKKFIRK